MLKEFRDFLMRGNIVELAVAFGDIDPILRTTEPAWNPLAWDFGAMSNVLERVLGGDLGGNRQYALTRREHEE